ncbi:maleate cis-trans isomerase family protein [Paraburkholderia hospita]|uniref:maleate cis-trans isomerase family protein n=1 Tax=Paraburkholderia hospita TaxID=169430 RepID=UPI000271A50F|nr:aspartate/glutamate racemase family protein [Paraburkholderia hospita]EUC18757.1 Asp/Glu/hydantoin racemase [Burkholderia sp. BT03]SKC61666.1 Maleate cis-trans isomerase [Paraburkholderia hospita]
MDIDYGSVGRIGLIVPSANVAAEPEIAAMLPPGVALYTTRLKLTGSSAADIQGMAARAGEGAELLADAEVDVIAFHCTAASAWSPNADQELTAMLIERSGLRATTTATALLNALDALEARSIVLVSPYVEEINAREIAFLRGRGISVLDQHGLGIADPHLMNRVDPQTWISLVEKHAHPDADAYFISCAAIRAAGVIETLEKRLGKPVVTSNQVIAWQSLRGIGIKTSVKRFGRLMEI